MKLETWWLYVTAVFLIACTPGPNMLHVMTRSIQVGPRRAGYAVAWCLTAALIYLCASAAGLGAILRASPGPV
jgi:threonine/homoserine/homoserine lactone efflux protein